MDKKPVLNYIKRMQTDNGDLLKDEKKEFTPFSKCIVYGGIALLTLVAGYASIKSYQTGKKHEKVNLLKSTETLDSKIINTHIPKIQLDDENSILFYDSKRNTVQLNDENYVLVYDPGKNAITMTPKFMIQLDGKNTPLFYNPISGNYEKVKK